MIKKENLFQTKMGTNHFTVKHWLLIQYNSKKSFLFSHYFESIESQIIIILSIFLPNWLSPTFLSILPAVQNNFIKLSLERHLLYIPSWRIFSLELLPFWLPKGCLIFLTWNIHLLVTIPSPYFLQDFAYLNDG